MKTFFLFLPCGRKKYTTNSAAAQYQLVLLVRNGWVDPPFFTFPYHLPSLSPFLVCSRFLGFINPIRPLPAPSTISLRVIFRTWSFTTRFTRTRTCLTEWRHTTSDRTQGRVRCFSRRYSSCSFTLYQNKISQSPVTCMPVASGRIYCKPSTCTYGACCVKIFLLELVPHALFLSCW